MDALERQIFGRAYKVFWETMQLVESQPGVIDKSDEVLMAIDGMFERMEWDFSTLALVNRRAEERDVRGGE